VLRKPVAGMDRVHDALPWLPTPVPVVDRLPSINDAALVALIIATLLSIPLHTHSCPRACKAAKPVKAVLDIYHVRQWTTSIDVSRRR
jgi:hypothetical protein